MPKIHLSEEFLIHGAIYGPGDIEIEDKAIAEALQKAEQRVAKTRGNGPVIKPNGVMTGILPGSEPAAPSNRYTPADAARDRDNAQRVAADAKVKEDADRAAADRAKGVTSANPGNAANQQQGGVAPKK